MTVIPSTLTYPIGGKMSGLVLNLAKGQTESLRGDLKFSVMMLGLGWDERKTPGDPIDVDPIVIGRNANGDTLDGNWVCFYNQPKIGWCQHSGDNTDGAGQLDESGDDERMWIDLTAVPKDIASIDLVINIFEAVKRRETFGDLSRGVIRLVNVAKVGEIKGDEKIRIELTADQYFDATGFLAITLKRAGPAWEVTRKDLTDPRWADTTSAANANNKA